jgi:hypothetical protein
MKTALFAGIALLAGAVPGAALAEPVLFISIDGLRPGDVIEAEQRGLTLPHLRRFIAEGSYASGVIGNLPTVTYPSHTTLMTGVAPARHGVVNNTTFDPHANQPERLVLVRDRHHGADLVGCRRHGRLTRLPTCIGRSASMQSP